MFALRVVAVTAALLCCQTSSVLGEQYKRVCYYTNWSQYRPGAGKFTPANIKTGLCTHIIYAFAKLENNQLHTLAWNDDKMMKEVNALKAQDKGLKTLVAVGGWNAKSYQFTKMVETYANRLTFVKSTIAFLRQHGFDGLDLDWEYPTIRGGKPADKANLVLLVKELFEAFTQEGQGRERLLLTAAVPAGQSNIDPGYDIPNLARYLDFINLMSYDLHGSWNRVTGINSPLYPRSSESGAAAQLNVKWAANYWVTKGTPKRKLIIGMPTYGRTFTLVNPNNHGIGAATSGAGTPGPYTRWKGFVSYYEICKRQETGGQAYWDDEQRVPYYVDGRLWVGYDNVKSIKEKARWLKSEGYGGAMIWALDTDDFGKMCVSSQRSYPLLNTIKDILSSGSFTTSTPPPTPPTTKTTSPTSTTSSSTASSSTASSLTASSSTKSPSTTSSSTTKTTTHPNTTDGKPKDFCADLSDGFYRDPSSCRGFYRCFFRRTYHYDCPGRTIFNAELSICDWPENVTC